MKALTCVAILLAIGLPSAASAAEPPPESLDKLQGVLRSVADGLWETSENAWHFGRHDICIELHRLIVEIDPVFTEAFSIGAWLISSAGREAEAVAMYKKGIAADPTNYRLHFDLGMHFYQKKDYSQAEASFSESVRHSAPASVWKMLAHARERLGRLEDALATWDKVKEMDSDDPVIERNAQRIRDQMSGVDPLPDN